jgi:hypothetical protein
VNIKIQLKILVSYNPYIKKNTFLNNTLTCFNNFVASVQDSIFFLFCTVDLILQTLPFNSQCWG